MAARQEPAGQPPSPSAHRQWTRCRRERRPTMTSLVPPGFVCGTPVRPINCVSIVGWISCLSGGMARLETAAEGRGTRPAGKATATRGR